MRLETAACSTFLSLAFLVSATSVAAEALTPFANKKNGVRNVLHAQNNDISEAQNLNYFPITEEEKAAEQMPEALPEDEKQEKDEKFDLREASTTPEEIVEKYGDPHEELPVLAQTDAPKSYRGLMEAVELGDSELAFAYARQYVRYMHDIQNRGNVISELIKKASLAEKMSDDDAEVESLKEVEEYEKHLKKYEGTLSPDAKKILDEAKLFENLENRDRKERELALKELPELHKNGKLPVDPQGKVALYFAFDPQQKESFAAAQVAEQLYQQAKKNPNFEVIGVTIADSVPVEAFKKFREETKSSFPAQTGTGVLSAMGITAAPQFVFVTQSTGQFHTRSGDLSRAYAGEIVKFMQGKAK